MQNGHESHRSLRDILGMLFRHKRKVIAFSAAVMVAVLVGVVVAPRKYVSAASLFFRIGRQSVSLDPSASTGPMLSVNDPLTTEISSALQIIEGRAIIERVVDRIGLEAFYGKNSDGPIKSLVTAPLRWIRRLDPVGPKESAVNLVQQSLSITAPKQARVIEITCRTESPELSQKVVATLVDEFLKAHMRINSTEGTHEFFVRQTAMAQAQLDKAMAEQRDLKNAMGATSIEAARQMLSLRLQGLDADRWLAGVNVATAQGRIDALNRSLRGVKERQPADEVSGFDNAAADQMRPRLYDLEIREKELAARYTDIHPLLSSIREQVDQARKVVDDMTPERTHRTTTVNLVYQQLELDQLREIATVKANKERIVALDHEIQRTLNDQKQLNESEIQFQSLSRQIDLLAANHRVYADKLEQSRIDLAVNQERISNVNIAQPASLVYKPVSPNKPVIVGLGLFVMIFGSLGLVFVCEYFDESLKTPRDVETYLELPVLLSIPRESRETVLLN